MSGGSRPLGTDCTHTIYVHRLAVKRGSHEWKGLCASGRGCGERAHWRGWTCATRSAAAKKPSMQSTPVPVALAVAPTGVAACTHVPDPRRSASVRYPLPAILALAIAAGGPPGGVDTGGAGLSHRPHAHPIDAAAAVSSARRARAGDPDGLLPSRRRAGDDGARGPRRRHRWQSAAGTTALCRHGLSGACPERLLPRARRGLGPRAHRGRRGQCPGGTDRGPGAAARYGAQSAASRGCGADGRSSAHLQSAAHARRTPRRRSVPHWRTPS